ncbi:MAG: hypothetical protein ABW185_26535, partial [Sedimenticola sp.]
QQQVKDSLLGRSTEHPLVVTETTVHATSRQTSDIQNVDKEDLKHISKTSNGLVESNDPSSNVSATEKKHFLCVPSLKANPPDSLLSERTLLITRM